MAPPLHIICIKKMLSCAGTNGLQTFMSGAFRVARVYIDKVIMSIHTKLQNKKHVVEALYRAKFKFSCLKKITSLRSGALLSLM